MKNRSTFGKLTNIIFSAGIMVLTSCTGSNINDTTTELQKSTSGTASVAINVGKIGQLAKRSAIEMEKLIVEIRVKDSISAIIKDTSLLSGSGAAVIKKTFPSLTAPENFVLQAKTFDKTGKLIHSGIKEFSTIPADTVDVSLDLDAMYSMLKVAFNNIPDSVSKVRLRIAAIDTLDSTFTRGARDTVVFQHDYIPAEKNGITHAISLEASGSFYGKDTVLFAADTTILAKAGKDTSYRIVLKWVGPGVPKGAATMSVTIGSVGTTTVNAGFGVMAVGIPVDGLVAYYPFNGNANDMSGNGNDGVVNGATLLADRFGKQSSAMNFTGIDNYIDCGSMPNLNNSNISLCGWIYTAPRTTSYEASVIVTNIGNYSTGYGFQVDLNNDLTGLRFHYRTTPSSGNSIIANKAYTDSWKFFCAVTNHTGTQNICLLFIDGKLVSTQSFSESINYTNINHFLIGNNIDGFRGLERYFKGSIDDIRLYNRALTESEIVALYHENGWSGN